MKRNEEHVYNGPEPQKIKDPNDTKYFYTFYEWVLKDSHDNSRDIEYLATYNCLPKPGYNDVYPLDEFDFVIEEGSSQYEYSHGYAAITGWDFKETGEDVIIPAWFNGYPVMQIHYQAFMGSRKLKTVVFSDTVRDFHQDEFKDCLALENIVFGKSMTYLSRNMFANCPGLVNLNIPEQIVKMGSYAFENCTGLQSLTLPDTFEEFEMGEFSGCINLTSVHIPELVENLDYTFAGCTALKDVTFEEGSKLISLNAFCDCVSLEYIEIPESVRVLYNNAFRGCEKLEEIYLPDVGVEQIHAYAFKDCVALSNIRLPISLKFIGQEAFENCQSLVAIDISFRVEEIEKHTFRDCPNLILMSVSSSNPKYDSRDDCNAIIETATNTLLYGIKISTIPADVEAIGDEAFNGSQITTLELNGNVKSIGRNAFYNTWLTSVTLEEGLVSIGEYAFGRCLWLGQIVIPRSVAIIDHYAFDSSSSLNIYAKATEKPVGWEYWWNSSDLPVYWYSETPNYDGNHWRYVDGAPTIWE